MPFTFTPIGIVRSPFKEKFGIPRQSGLVPEARGVLEILPPYDREEAFRGLEDFTHIWLVFVFHASLRDDWKPTVRPPRLGGNQRIGVFATRSGFRPNGIGLSAVRLEKIVRENGILQLRLGGLDLLDGTPVLDIKPYLPYADSIPEAQSSFAPSPPEPVEVTFSERADARCRELEAAGLPAFRQFVVRILSTDPRPAYVGASKPKRVFGNRVYDVDIRWTFDAGSIHVLDIVDREKKESESG